MWLEPFPTGDDDDEGPPCDECGHREALHDDLGCTQSTSPRFESRPQSCPCQRTRSELRARSPDAEND